MPDHIPPNHTPPASKPGHHGTPPGLDTKPGHHGPSPGLDTKPSHGPQGLGRDHPAQGIPGPVMILVSALGCVALFFIVWATLRGVEHHLDASRPTLAWADRTNWQAPAVIKTTLVKPNAANAQYTYNKPRYRDPGFAISTEEERAVLACAEAARQWSDPSDAYDLPSSIAHTPHFYAEYLRATFFRLGNDRKKQAAKRFQFAIDNAPRILVIQYTDTTGKPVANLKLGRVEIGCDRVTHEGQTLDQRLVLVYPHLETDAAGRVYLPVYDTTYRPVYLPQPDGYQTTYSPDEGWFKTATRLGLIKAQAKRLAE